MGQWVERLGLLLAKIFGHNNITTEQGLNYSSQSWKSFITHMVFCLNVTWCKPVHEVQNQWDKNLLYALWHTYLMKSWLLNKINILGYNFVWKRKIKPMKRTQTRLKHARHTVLCAGDERKILFYILGHNFFSQRDTAWQGSISCSWEKPESDRLFICFIVFISSKPIFFL